MRRAGILTFHNTPNFGATLQCYALYRRLEAEGVQPEVINYMPVHTMVMYARSQFAGARRSIHNLRKIQRFYRFFRSHMTTSGRPVFSAGKLRELSDRYDIAFTGSDEVWKVDHMRKLDTAFYFDFLDSARTRLSGYAASASTVTDLRDYEGVVAPLMRRFSGLGVRDPHTAEAVAALTGRRAVEVLDPTFIWPFAEEDLPSMHPRPYVAVYAWMSNAGMAAARAIADGNGLDLVCVGCRHPRADRSYVGIGPREWLRLIRHSELVVTNFFHGIAFALIFGRRLFAYVDPKKRMKLHHLMDLAGLGDKLREAQEGLAGMTLADCDVDHERVEESLAPRRAASLEYLRTELEAVRERPLQL